MKVRLKDVFHMQMGKTPSRNNLEYWGKGHKWVSIADIGNSGKYIFTTKESITDIGIIDSGIKIVPAQTVIMSFKLTIGKVAITSEEMFTNEAIIAFIDKGIYDIDTNYFYHLCCGKEWTSGSNKAVMGLTLNKKTLSEKTISLPDIKEQRAIAAELDKVDDLIDKTKKELELLGHLVKSRFIEMFGDPLATDTKWAAKPLKSICSAILGGGTPSKRRPDYYLGNIPWVTPKDMKSLIIEDSQDHITEEAIQNSTTKTVPVGSVLMVIRSGILKHTLPVAINTRLVTINQDMKAFVPKNEVLAEYLIHYFKAVEAEVLGGVRSVTADNIDFKEFQKRSIPVPPIELQKSFAEFSKLTDKSKYAIQRSLEELDTLKKALMQQYFG